MKFVAQMCALFLIMFSFTAYSDTNSTIETYHLINSTNLAKPGCNTTCGDLIVPYPFGIGLNSNCSIEPGFDIYCNTSANPPRGALTELEYNSIKLISDSTIRTSNMVASTCYLQNGTISSSFSISYDFRNRWPYTFSQVNKFIVIGCDDYAWLTSATKSRNVSTGCMAFCRKPEEVTGGECSGNGCCESSIPQDINYYKTELNTLVNSDDVNYTRSFDPCTYAFVGEENTFKFNGASDLNDSSFVDRTEASVPIVLEWAIGNLSCAEAEATNVSACQANSMCVNSTRETGGYRCVCKEGYEGNPYLFPGCQDINECDFVEKFQCYGTCVNTIGSYLCKCKGGYSGDAKVQDGCQKKSFTVLKVSLGVGLGFISLVGLLALHLMVQKRKLIKLRKKFYEQNGGGLLEGNSGSNFMKIYQAKELEEATNNYAEDMILGRGGNGIVYKGTLPDKCVVAIKKSQRLDEGQRVQFINEMIILAQLNHPNVVQLLGCCLETEVPLLVYEFVSNDTLYHHIHNRTSRKLRLSWDSRLRIAHESAGALAYLHTDARMSIIHRDVKSTNILLDENYTAKIADFGASRLVPLGHDQVITLVQGTVGYLDPEYFHTGQLTDKSDVYSFGVVLAELLTGKKPLGIERDINDRNLATYFVKAKKEDQLHEILDIQVVKEATDEQLKAACNLVCRCLTIAGGNRPSMSEVTMELGKLRKTGKHHPWIISQEKYNETSSLMIESEESDLYTVPLVANSDTYAGSSSNTRMSEMMLQVQNPR